MTKKILIVEDEEHILELLLRIFDGYKEYDTLCARDGEEALRMVRQSNPDIILLDIQIPKIDGYDVCESLKTDTATSRIRVLMLSGSAQYSDWQRVHEVGADAYIAKPFRIHKLMEKVEELLRSNE